MLRRVIALRIKGTPPAFVAVTPAPPRNRAVSSTSTSAGGDSATGTAAPLPWQRRARPALVAGAAILASAGAAVMLAPAGPTATPAVALASTSAKASSARGAATSSSQAPGGLSPLEVEARLLERQTVTLLGRAEGAGGATEGGAAAKVLKSGLLWRGPQYAAAAADAAGYGGCVVRFDTNEVASNDPIEDRHCQKLTKHGLLFGIFDGHGGHECADVVSKVLPAYLAKELDQLPAPPPAADPSTAEDEQSHARAVRVRTAIENAFVKLDQDITGLALDMPDWGPGDAMTLQMQQISLVPRLRAALAGSCALVAYIEGRDVYVACTGDSRAVLGRRTADGAIEAVDLSLDQTFKNPNEYRRLLEEHPGEQDTVVVRGRILGRLMPTRAFGDSKYKWPANVQDVLIPQLTRRNVQHPSGYRTPPYVTAQPVVSRYRLDPLRDRFLVLATDGLYDELDSASVADVVGGFMLQRGAIDMPAQPWVRVPGTNAKASEFPAVGSAATPWCWQYGDASAATCLVRNALGGRRLPDGSSEASAGSKAPMPPEERLARILAIPPPYSRRFRDDITVTVAFFDGGAGIDGSGGEAGGAGVRASDAFHPERLAAGLQGVAAAPVERADHGAAAPKRRRLEGWVDRLTRPRL
ncbi:hypothetical protein HK405_008504 [Cladochytrium tenue]|nr:hypothetical protein HK405_008504 [Cladochytrium tenue]